jgi:hypothetical protein
MRALPSAAAAVGDATAIHAPARNVARTEMRQALNGFLM